VQQVIRNINQICLENLSIKIGIPIRHGWKSALSERLHQKKQSVISLWIRRGVPKDFEAIIKSAGIHPIIWREIIENVDILSEQVPYPVPADHRADVTTEIHEVKKGEDKTVPMEEHMHLMREHIACLKELNEARKQINKFTAIPAGADVSAASSGKRGT
jgi:hypothetical protein